MEDKTNMNNDDIRNEYLRYNKISTGISGLDVLLYDGLVIPYDKKNGGGKTPNQHRNLLIVIRGNDEMDRTILSLQLLQAIGSAFKKQPNADVKTHYYSNFLKEGFFYDLQLDILISSAVKSLVEKSVSGVAVGGKEMTEFFFDTERNVQRERRINVLDKLPLKSIKENPDGMICGEALYYNARTNSLHFRMSSTKMKLENRNTDAENVVYRRKFDTLNDYLQSSCESSESESLQLRQQIKAVEDKVGMRFMKTDFHRCEADQVADFKNDGKELEIGCFNFSLHSFTDGEKEQNFNTIGQWMGSVRNRFKVGILVLDRNVEFPEEKADMILEMGEKEYESYEYTIHTIEITKSLFQMTVLGQHQYKRRDFGIEVYPSLPVYCMQRRYLQRALVYTHSNVLRDTYQQYLDNSDGEKLYFDYEQEIDEISKGYFNALNPTANKKVSVHQVLDRVFINPRKDKGTNISEDISGGNLSESSFLYGVDAGVTAVIGDANSYKRFLTYGSAFSSAHKSEHTLFLLLNKDDKVVRRRLLCPARKNKCNISECKRCYEHLHFMNILMGCITPEEFLSYLMRQIDTEFHDGKIKRVVIDDLQIIDYCFPLLLQDTLFLPALIDECKNRGIALYVLCDKKAGLVNCLRSLADNIVCMERKDEKKTVAYVERYAGYHTTPSKIFTGGITRMEDLFECYERGSRGNKKSYFNFDSDTIKEEKVFTMKDFWN